MDERMRRYMFDFIASELYELGEARTRQQIKISIVDGADKSEPPPGYDIAQSVEGGREVFRYTRNIVGPAGVGLIGVAIGEPCERREQAVHLAWNRYEGEQGQQA